MCAKNNSLGKLTVYFDNPFWVGVFERVEGKRFSACKITFGAEPKDCEVWEFVLKNYGKLKFSPSVKAEQKQTADNPKRRLRNAKKQLKNTGVGIKSQQALAAEREAVKNERKKNKKEQKAFKEQYLYELKKQKRKKKHKGR